MLCEKSIIWPIGLTWNNINQSGFVVVVVVKVNTIVSDELILGNLTRGMPPFLELERQSQVVCRLYYETLLEFLC